MLSLPRKRLSLIIVSLVCFVLIVVIVFAFVRYGSLTFSPVTEQQAMDRLDQTKAVTSLSLFVTDGCSGNVSSGWTEVVNTLSAVSTRFADSYAETTTIPFEAACIEHDRAYHTGEGGYIGRLRADMQLRADIIEYAIANTEEIQSRTGLRESVQVIHLYEQLADAIYHAVRLGGAPCSGKPYAWGYGYNAGNCLGE